MKFPKHIQEAIEEYQTWNQDKPFRLRKIPSKEVLEKLYWKYRSSHNEIVKLFKVCRATVRQWFRRYNIRVRDPIKASIIANTRWPKKSFSGELKEMASLIGFRLGDLTVRKSGLQIVVSTATTDPSTIALIRKLFSPCTVVKIFPRKSTGYTSYKWGVYCNLDLSFKFLLRKSIPQWVLKDEDYFHAFLAGFFDAEGCISIHRNKVRYIQRVFLISNYNEALSEALRNKLCELGYDARLRKGNGRVTGVHLYRKEQIMKLVSKLPLRHPGKLKQRKLFLETVNAKYWSEIEDKVIALRNKTKNERKRYIEEAKKEWWLRRCNIPA
jgi:intein-encoded DNA endonuclease-like protein